MESLKNDWLGVVGMLTVIWLWGGAFVVADTLIIAACALLLKSKFL